MLYVGTGDAAIGTNIAYRRSVNNGSNWAPYVDTGVVSASGPAVASSAAGRIDLVTKDRDGTARHTWFVNGRRAGTRNLGGSVTATPAVSSRGDGTLDVFARGASDAIFRNHYGPSGWSGWRSLGGPFSSAPSASVKSSDGSTLVTGRGADGVALQRTVTPSSDGSGWVRGAAQIWSAEAVADDYGRGRVSLSGTSDSAVAYTRGSVYLQGIAATFTSAPAVASRTDGTWAMVGRSRDNALWMYDARPGQYRGIRFGGVVR